MITLSYCIRQMRVTIFIVAILFVKISWKSFGSHSVIQSVEISSYFSFFSAYRTVVFCGTILAKHAINPYYASVLSKQPQQEVLQDALGDGQPPYTRIGIRADSICKSR